MSKKYEYIDGHRFKVKVDGMTLVDTYYIPYEYIKDRESMTQKAKKIFEKHCHEVSIDFKGSQDGEALVGRDEEGEIQLFIHLDPDGIEMMKKADQEGQLEKVLLEYAD